MKLIDDTGFVPWPAPIAQHYRDTGVWAGKTLWSILREAVDARPDATALVCAHRRLSYRALWAESLAWAHTFVRRGLSPGDRVVVQLPSEPALLCVCFALWRIGVRPVMALPAHRARELTHFAHKSRASAYITRAQLGRNDGRALATQLMARAPSVTEAFFVDDEPEGRTETEAALPEPPHAGDIALFQLSGGSTDVPKLIARTHDDYLYSIRQSVAVCGFDATTVYLAVLPVAHNFPLSSPGVLGTLFAGGCVVLSEHAAPDLAFDMLERSGANTTALVPALVPAWLAAAERRRSSVATLRHVQVGGAKLSAQLARRIPEELGARLQQVFGMAEGLVCYTRFDEGPEHALVTQGKPMSPLDELRVVDEDDRPLPVGEAGQLLVRGPYTIRGYYDAEAYNRLSFTADGFYRTGDRVRLLEDGSVVVEGRIKDQINRGGEKIAAPEVEAALCEHERVEQAAVVPFDDAYLGERSLAFVVLRGPLDEASLRRHIQQCELAAYKMPDRFAFVSALPKTPFGKVDKRALRRLANQIAGARPSPDSHEAPP